MVMLVASSRAFSSPACRCHSGRCQVDEKTSFGSNAVRNRWLVQGQWLEKGPFRPKSSEIREVFVAHAPHLGHLRCICVRLCVAHHTSRCKSATLVPIHGSWRFKTSRWLVIAAVAAAVAAAAAAAACLCTLRSQRRCMGAVFFP